MTDRKRTKRRIHVERDVAGAAPAALSPGEMYQRAMAQQQARLDRDLPWRASYVNWCTHVGRAAAKCNAVIAFGTETYAAWESGISPEEYARAHARE